MRSIFTFFLSVSLWLGWLYVVALAVLDEVNVRNDSRVLLVCGHFVVPVPVMEVVFYGDFLRNSWRLISPFCVLYSILSVKVVVQGSVH